VQENHHDEAKEALIHSQQPPFSGVCAPPRNVLRLEDETLLPVPAIFRVVCTGEQGFLPATKSSSSLDEPVEG